MVNVDNAVDFKKQQEQIKQVIVTIKNIVIILFFLFFILFGTYVTISRLYWVNSGSGIIGTVGNSFYEQLGIDCPGSVSVEVKRGSDGVLEYRCGAYLMPWPFSRIIRSQILTDRWKSRYDALRLK